MMGDNGADLTAMDSLPPADTAGDPAPQSPCGSGERWFLPSSCFQVVLGAWKVSVNLPRGLFTCWEGPRLVSPPGCDAVGISCF